MEFESNIGDLSSIIKVEKRRAQAIEKMCKTVSETAWLVDRYRFQDLLPCSSVELKCIGYSLKQTRQFSGVGTIVNSNLSSISTYPKPDFSQMVPFKPKINPSKCPYEIHVGEWFHYSFSARSPFNTRGNIPATSSHRIASFSIASSLLISWAFRIC